MPMIKSAVESRPGCRGCAPGQRRTGKGGPDGPGGGGGGSGRGRRTGSPERSRGRSREATTACRVEGRPTKRRAAQTTAAGAGCEGHARGATAQEAREDAAAAAWQARQARRGGGAADDHRGGAARSRTGAAPPREARWPHGCGPPWTRGVRGGGRTARSLKSWPLGIGRTAASGLDRPFEVPASSTAGSCAAAFVGARRAIDRGGKVESYGRRRCCGAA